jgi:adenosylmethionine---8-amino-7-oxononanoate aminotransferase
MIWYPYSQMKTTATPYTVVSANGVEIELDSGEKLIDAISSWWCVIHGYNHPEINQAAKEQLDKVSHIMLGGLVNEPAKKLAEKLVEITPARLTHVFYADSGSVGVEVALKMAVQYWQNLGYKQKTKILALEKAYHGDTTGAMSVCDPEEGMHSLFSGILPQQFFIPAPSMGYKADENQLKKDLNILEQFLEKNHTKLAAFIVEPIMQAAGGFNFYAPEYLTKARAFCDRFDVLLIFDEVATGFGRTGTLFAADQTNVSPDIMVLGKGLTAGYIGHAATIANDKIFSAFYSKDESKAFMHGPTFMGNPLACAIALKSIEIFERENYLEKIKKIETLLNEEFCLIKSDLIKDIRVLGATGVIEVKNKETLKNAQTFAAENGVWLRPFENYLYTMPPYIINDQDLMKITNVINNFFKK